MVLGERDLRQYELSEEDWEKIDEIRVVLQVSFYFILLYLLYINL
jgi:hypothetical protein